MKVRVIQQGDQTFTYDGQDEASIRQALLHEPGVPSIVYDITDLDRSDMDADEYLIATEDDGTPVWSGWLGGVTGPPPALAMTVTPIGYQGPAAHTYTPTCAGHHPPMEPCPPAAPPSSSIVRDILLLAGEDVPTETIDHWTLPELLEVTAWASAEHLSASDNPVKRLQRPSVLGGAQ